MVVWELPKPVPPCVHHFKYRLFYGIRQRLGKTAACMAPTVATTKDWQRRGFRMISYSYDTGLLQESLSVGIQALKAD